MQQQPKSKNYKSNFIRYWIIICNMAGIDSDNSSSYAKKYGRIALGIMLGLCFLYFIGGCSLETLHEPDYHIGQDDRWRSLGLRGKERNLSAFNVELLASIAKQEQFQARLTAALDPVRDLENGKLQGIFTSLKPSYLNENHILFSETFFPTGPVLIISSTSPEKRWNEKRKKILGIESQSPIRQSFEQDPAVQLKIYEDILPALSDLAANRIDGAIFPTIPAHIYVNTFYKDELKISTLPLTDDGIKLAALKDERGAALIKSFNEGLKKIKENGSYAQMLERWGFRDLKEVN